MINKKITIIGTGHMGQALAKGFIIRKSVLRRNLVLASPYAEKLNFLKKKLKVKVFSDNRKAVKYADIIIIAVKPRVVKDVITEIRGSLNKQTILVSTAACMPIKLLDRYLIDERKIFRIMPNILISIGKGVIGWKGNKNIDKEDKEVMIKLFSPLGLLLYCKQESALDKLTLISGCGPALVGYFINQMEKVAEDLGFDQKIAKDIVMQNFEGTIKYLKTYKLNTDSLILKVATKGGITDEILNTLNKYRFIDGLFRSMKKGYDKIKTIRQEMNYGNN